MSRYYPHYPSPPFREAGRVRSYGGIAGGVHLFPFRTEKLSPSWPMVLHNNAGE